MTIIRIPTPLRPYTGGKKEVTAEGKTVGSLIQEVVSQYPLVQPHLYDENGVLRAYVNLFLNDEDVRHLDGYDTVVEKGDKLMIVPSIAGGSTEVDTSAFVDHASLRTNQAIIIILLLIAFITDLQLLVLFVALAMLIGTVTRKPGFLFPYKMLKMFGVLKPEVLEDHAAPHQFAQGFGSAVLFLSFSAATLDYPLLGWVFVWIVVFLAALNLLIGFCAGCAMYYWFNRLGIPFFHLESPGDRIPGTRPPRAN
jgi:molybdopterin converting factor small subunit